MRKRTKEQIYVEWLVIRCQGGERKAVTELVSLWQQQLSVYVLRSTGCKDDANDIMQEIWISVFKKLRSLNDPASFPQWIYKIASARCADWVRKKKKNRKILKVIAQDSVSIVDENISEDSNDTQKKLKNAIKQLPVDSQTILSLFYIDELSVSAIAEVYVIPIGTVKSRLFNVRKLLKEIIERSD